MTKRNNVGMWLRQTSDSQRKDTHFLIQALVALLTAIVLTMMTAALIGVDSGDVLLVIAITASVSCALYGILLKVKQEKWFYISLLSALLLMTLFCRQQMLEGFRICWNQAGDAVLRGTGWVIQPFELQLDASNGKLCTALFTCMVSCAGALLCCALVTYVPVVLAILPGAVVLIGMILLCCLG